MSSVSKPENELTRVEKSLTSAPCSVGILLSFAKEFACDDGDFIRQLSAERQRNDYRDEISFTCCCALELLRNARLYQPTFNPNANARLGKVVLTYVMTVYSTLWSVPGEGIHEPNRPFGQLPDDCYYHACPHRFLVAANINAEADSPPEWLGLRAADWLWVQRSVVIVHYIINSGNRDLDLDAAEKALKTIREEAIRAQKLEQESEAGTMSLFILSISLDIQGIRKSGRIYRRTLTLMPDGHWCNAVMYTQAERTSVSPGLAAGLVVDQVPLLARQQNVSDAFRACLCRHGRDARISPLRGWHLFKSGGLLFTTINAFFIG